MNRLLEFTNIDYKNNVLEFRKKSVDLWLNILLDIVPKILENDKFLKNVSVSYEDPSTYTYYGFSARNIKILKINGKIGNKRLSRNIYLPIPDRNDMFKVNGSWYILINKLADKPCTIYKDSTNSSASIRIKNIYVSPDGYVKTPGYKKLNTILFLTAIDVLEKNSFEIKRRKEIKESELKNYDIITKTNVFKIYGNFSINKNDPFFKNIIIPAIEIFSKKDFNILENKEKLEHIKTTIDFFDLGAYFKILIGIDDISKRNTEILKPLFLRYIIPEYKNNMNNKFYTLSTKRVMYYDIIISRFLSDLERYVKSNETKKQPPKDIHIAQESILKWLISSNPFFEYCDISEMNLFLELNNKESIYFPLDYYKDQYRNLDFTFKYNVDPINTPDSDKIGQKQRLSTSVELDTFGNFVIQ